ncbi:MAG: MBOAT family protein [Anaerolineae bacterium]|nr:MBOAT family protein [Anaerolineae bacterium]
MNVDLLTIGLFVVTAVLYTLFIPGRWRGWFLFGSSVLAIYWLQTFTPLRFADYLLQTLTILLTVLTWWVTRPDKPSRVVRSDWVTLLVLFGLVLVVAGNRYVAAEWRFTSSRPPSVWWVAVGLVVIAGLWAILWRWLRRVEQRTVCTAVILLIVFIFVWLKTPALATATAVAWRSLTGQQVALAAPSDLVWLGFSYVAFRLIHTLRDHQTGQLPPLSLREFITYVLFFTSYIAGPIDRVERFVADLRQEEKTYTVMRNPYSVNRNPNSVTHHASPVTDYAPRYWQGSARILTGLFKKFVIADTLALGMSLTAVNAAQSTSTFWLWVLLYGYALRLYFDFAGYTDIAIGIGILFGVKLPENFRRPYLSTNITAFWQRWHISLSDWARFYIFSPLSRSLLRRQRRPSNTIILFTAHLSTMAVIGLWHGITVNFFIWGLWQGVALFVHKQWSDRSRRWYRGLSEKPWQKRLWTAVTWFLTFQYVTLGWVWFALPTPQLALETFAKLFSLR